MKIVDLNILIYAVNQEAPQHGPIRLWWEAALEDEEPVGLAWIVLVGFLRLSTKPEVFPNPLTVEQALGQVDRWIGHPGTSVIAQTADHWNVLQELLRDTGTGVNRTTDAHLAALAVTRGALLVSCDTDFARFRGLRYLNPLVA
jgi:toxin-antitoxin system PIN domain toxin